MCNVDGVASDVPVVMCHVSAVGGGRSADPKRSRVLPTAARGPALSRARQRDDVTSDQATQVRCAYAVVFMLDCAIVLQLESVC